MSMRCAALGIVLLTGAGSLSSSAAEGSVSGALELGISVPKETFVQGEPVPITVEIRNRSQKDVEVVTDLEPEFGTLTFRVTDPEGETWTPRPHVQGGSLGRKTALNPGDRLTHTVLLVSGVVRGAGRFIFRDTGRYAVQALYGGAVSSEPIAITIIEAQGLDIEARRLFMGPEQREVPVGPGVSRGTVDTIRHMAREYSTSRDAPLAGHFPRMDYQLIELFEGILKEYVGSMHQIIREYPTSTFAPYAGYYLGMHYQRGEDYKESIELFERILKDYKDFPVWADVMYQLAIAYRETGREDKARQYIRQLISKDPSHLAARRGKKFLRELQSD